MKREVSYTELVCDVCGRVLGEGEELLNITLPGKKIEFECYVPIWDKKLLRPIRAEICPKCAMRIYRLLEKEMVLENRREQGVVAEWKFKESNGEIGDEKNDTSK